MLAFPTSIDIPSSSSSSSSSCCPPSICPPSPGSNNSDDCPGVTQRVINNRGKSFSLLQRHKAKATHTSRISSVLCIDGVVALIIELLEEPRYWSRALTKLSISFNRTCHSILSPERDTGSLWIRLYRGRWNNCPWTDELAPILKWFVVDGTPPLSEANSKKNKLYSIDEWKGRFVLRVLGDKAARVASKKRYTHRPKPYSLNNNPFVQEKKKRKRPIKRSAVEPAEPAPAVTAYIWSLRILTAVRAQSLVITLIPEEQASPDTILDSNQAHNQSFGSNSSSTSSSSTSALSPATVHYSTTTNTSIENKIVERKRKQREEDENKKKVDIFNLSEWEIVENLIPRDVLAVLNTCTEKKDKAWPLLSVPQKAFFTVLSQLDTARFHSSKGLWITKGGTCVASQKDLSFEPNPSNY